MTRSGRRSSERPRRKGFGLENVREQAEHLDYPPRRARAARSPASAMMKRPRSMSTSTGIAVDQRVALHGVRVVLVLNADRSASSRRPPERRSPNSFRARRDRDLVDQRRVAREVPSYGRSRGTARSGRRSRRTRVAVDEHAVRADRVAAALTPGSPGRPRRRRTMSAPHHPPLAVPVDLRDRAVRAGEAGPSALLKQEDAVAGIEAPLPASARRPSPARRPRHARVVETGGDRVEIDLVRTCRRRGREAITAASGKSLGVPRLLLASGTLRAILSFRVLSAKRRRQEESRHDPANRRHAPA